MDLRRAPKSVALYAPTDGEDYTDWKRVGVIFEASDNNVGVGREPVDSRLLHEALDTLENGVCVWPCGSVGHEVSWVVLKGTKWLRRLIYGIIRGEYCCASAVLDIPRSVMLRKETLNMSESIQEDTPQKQCRTCKQFKPATAEFFNATALYQSSDGLNKQCKQCRNAYRKAYNESKLKVPSPQSECKVCLVCKKQFPATLEYFCINRDTRDCLNAICKECSMKKHKSYRKRAGGLEARQAYRESRREHDKTYHKAYREQHKEHERQYRRHYRKLHHDAILLYQRKRDQTAKGKAARHATYYRRLARKKAIPGAYTAQDVLNQRQRQREKCYYCHMKLGNGKNAYHVDHVFPLHYGGSNGPENIVIACPTCNMRKGDKPLHEWFEGGRLL